MPCTYYSPGEEAAIAREELNAATRAACELLSIMPGYSDGAWDEISPETIRWCKRHQKMDRDRRAAERVERERKAKKRAALKKLSSEDRKVLGI